MKLYAYNPKSGGARRLARAMGIRRIKHQNSKFNNPDEPVINWGATGIDGEWAADGIILNRPELVRNVACKRRFFKLIQELCAEYIAIPFMFDKDQAIAEVEDGGYIYCRTVLAGHSGSGIVIARNPDEVVDAALYTVGVPIKAEYRIHIVHGKVIDYARKARTYDVDDEDVNWFVRNHKNGFIYKREDVEVPEDAISYALEAMSLTNLHFGAVDVLVSKTDRAYVLEINSAPGLHGTTIARYAQALTELGNKF